jgi:hypothetical protein
MGGLPQELSEELRLVLIENGLSDRADWVALADRIARPVLTHLANHQLKVKMPVEHHPAGTLADRQQYTYLEALGRTLTGIAPWLELPSDTTPEGRLRDEFASLAQRALDAGTDPKSPDYLNFTHGGQPLVDSAFLAHALLRAPHHLWDPLSAATKTNVVSALKSSRAIKPGENNWLLFAAMVEAFLHHAGEPIDVERVDHAIARHKLWYKGDGVYGDGPNYHADYYNSFVIHPMLLDVLEELHGENAEWAALLPIERARAQRYAAIQERLISPEGTFPPTGRSLAYRIGVFQALGQIALRGELPHGVAPAQVRGALSAVYRRMMNAPGVFDAGGWLTIGFAGHQPFIGETYISTGSAYLCSAGLLPLGLPATDPFWSDPPAEWTARRLWGGGVVPIDHAV